MKEGSGYTRYSLGLITAFLVFRVAYIATTHYNLIADEAYFWDWARHLSYGYYDMGPMVAWIIAFFTTLLPLSEFSVRLGAPVFSALTSLLVLFLARDITKSDKLAFISVLLYNITPIASAYGIIMTYYTPQIFFMALTAFFLWKLIREGNPVWWYGIGASLGLGLLSHHMFVFFTAEVGLFIILSGNNRKWLRSKELYLALLIELIIVSPLIIWNLTHQLVIAKHAAYLMHRKPDFIKTFLDYLGGQAGVHTPLLFFAVLYSITVSGYRGIMKKDDTHLFLFCLSAPVLVFVAILCLGGRVEANWPVTAYITGTISAVMIMHEKFQSVRKTMRVLIQGAFIVTVVLGFVALMVASYPSVISRSIGIAIPPKYDPANRLYGWKELGREVSAVVGTMPEGSFVSTNSSYGLNAQLAFYVDGNPEIYAIPKGRRSSQYDFWNGSIDVDGRDSVYINKRSIRNKIAKLFDKVELAKHLIIYDDTGNEIRTEFYIYRCYGYKGVKDESGSKQGE
jgi:hypothetical protein